MPSKTLRSLAKDHASGVLDKVAYRKARDLLFDGVLTSKITVEPIDFRPPLDIQDLDATMERERDKTQIKNIPVQKQSPTPTSTQTTTQIQVPVPETAPEEYSTDTGSGITVNLVLGIAIVIIIGLIIFLALPLIFQKADNVTTVDTDNSTVTESDISITENQATGNTSAGEELIAEFLAQNDWSDDTLQAFKSSWNSLTAEEQADGLSSPIKGQLANAIYQQLLEERALLGLGDTASVISRQNTLVDFASGLGINDPRLKAQENQ